MAEGRMLKRKISSDGRIGQLSVHSALLYTMSIPHLDREGRMAGSPVAVRGAVVPALAEAHPDEWSDRLVASYVVEWTSTTDEVTGLLRPLVLHYCIRGMWVCQFLGFQKNQKLRWDREASSLFPEPPEHLSAYLDPEEDAAPPPSRSLEGRQFTPLDPLRSKADEELLRLLLRNRARQMEKRARGKRVYVEHIDLYAIGEACAWTCHICEQPITILRGRESESLSFDHLVPIEEGGHHVTSNLAAAHFGCNASKRVRALSRYSRPEAEAQVQVQEPLADQRQVSRARAEEENPAALPDESDFGGNLEDPLAGVVAAVERRRSALGTHGPLARLLEVLPDADAQTPRVLHALFDPLGEAAIELAREEILMYGDEVRRPAAYAVGIGRRLAEEGAGVAAKRRRRGARLFASLRDERMELSRPGEQF